MSNNLSYITRTAGYGAPVTQVQASVPGSLSNGDLVLSLVQGLSAITEPVSGWKTLGRGGGSNQFGLFAKYYAGETGQYTFEQSSSSFLRATIVAYSGDFPANIDDLVHVLSNTNYGDAGTLINAAGVTTTEDDLDIIWIGGCYRTSSVTFPTIPVNPGTFSKDFEDGDTTSYMWQSFARYTWASSGSTGDMYGYLSASVTNNKHAFGLVLNPPSVGGRLRMSIGM